MKRINLLPNVITAFGLACGLFVIFRVNMTGEGTYELLYHMSLILIVAGFADVLDGAVARAIKGESEFGLVFDSLADAVSFGVAPSVLMLKTLHIETGSPLRFYALAAAMLYTVCGVLRLVRYNVKAAQSKEMDTDKKGRKMFIGLPIPAAAASVIAPNLLLNTPLLEGFIEISMLAKAIILPSVAIIMGYLMVSRFRFPSLKAFHFRFPSFNFLFVTTLIALAIFYGLLYYTSILLFILSWGYIILALTLAMIRRIKYRKTKTLEDYEISDTDDDDLSE